MHHYEKVFIHSGADVNFFNNKGAANAKYYFHHGR